MHFENYLECPNHVRMHDLPPSIFDGELAHAEKFKRRKILIMIWSLKFNNKSTFYDSFGSL